MDENMWAWWSFDCLTNINKIELLIGIADPVSTGEREIESTRLLWLNVHELNKKMEVSEGGLTNKKRSECFSNILNIIWVVAFSRFKYAEMLAE